MRSEILKRRHSLLNHTFKHESQNVSQTLNSLTADYNSMEVSSEVEPTQEQAVKQHQVDTTGVSSLDELRCRSPPDVPGDYPMAEDEEDNAAPVLNLESLAMFVDM